MKRLPLILGIAHAIGVCSVFGAALRDPEDFGYAPMIIAVVDFPISILVQGIRWIIYNNFDAAYNATIFIDGTLFLTIGTAWAYFIGWIFSRKTAPSHNDSGNQ